MSLPPKPVSRTGRVSMWRYLRLFRRDILSAQPERLYHAWMAEFRTPFFRSFLVNQPELVQEVLKLRPEAFPKSERIGEGLRPLLGNSVFVTNGDVWTHQRRIIDPAFEGGRLRATFPAMQAAADAAVARLAARLDTDLEIEAEMSHVAADVIFRTLFSIPIEDATARAVFDAFRAHQRSQPILNLAAFVPLPAWVPRGHKRRTRETACTIRDLITQMTQDRAAAIKAGTAPDDLATKIMTTPDPQTGARFSTQEMVDQVAIFFLAGHETSASALSWALYLLAIFPEWQDRLAQEAADQPMDSVADIAGLQISRDVFRETLRLYPPVPMMVREAAGDEVFRKRRVPRGAQIVLSPWHLHRHQRLWDNPDGFDPGRWATPEGQISARDAYLPFSAGPRICPGAGFAMIEGPLVLSMILRRFRITAVEGQVPQPQAHLTVRSANGIWLRCVRR
jgi:cytochrome P450